MKRPYIWAAIQGECEEDAMTPQERQLIDELFDRLAKVESAPRDAEAMSAIMQGLRNAPNAIYPLVQTVLLQDEALRRAAERIEQLEQGAQRDQGQSGGGFLDSMRDKLFGQSNQSHGSVPNVPPPQPESRPVWNSGQVLQQSPLQQGQGQGHYDQGYGQGYGQGAGYGGPGYGQGPLGGPQSAFGGGGSFLGTAAATAAGFIGGSLLMNSIRGMMGGGHRQAFGDTALAGDRSASPWGGDQSSSSAARDLGVNDIGRGDQGSGAGLVDQASIDRQQDADQDQDYEQDAMEDSDDFGGDDDSDYA
jgi:hypothetical protein